MSDSLRIHVLQHVPFENEGAIAAWAQKHNHPITRTCFYLDEKLPSIKSFDLLIVMGGPMNIYEEDKYPWLEYEKTFLKEAVSEGKLILGICLGAQLLADILGAKVTQNDKKEIGWFPVTLQQKDSSVLFQDFPDNFTALHWHGDMFLIPQEAHHTAKSVACSNQAFEYRNHVFGLQFHLESTTDGLRALIKHCSNELVEGEFIQKEEEILSYLPNHSIDLVEILLNNIARLYQPTDA